MNDSLPVNPSPPDRFDDAPRRADGSRATIVYVANTSWYLLNFRSSLMSRARDAGWRVLCVAPEDRFSARLVENGFEYIPLRLTRGVSAPFHELSTLAQLVKIYRREKPAIVHHFTVKPVVYGSFAARLTNVPATVNAITGRGHLFTGESLLMRTIRRLAVPVYRWAVNRRGSWTIFQHGEDRDLFIRLGIAQPERTSIVAGSGVNLEKFSPAEDDAAGVPTVLFCGRMLLDKGLDVLAAASRILRERGVRFRLLLVGPVDADSPSSISTSVLTGWQREGIAEWLGHRDDMAGLMGSSSVVALPTTYGEGVPRSLVEAAASGKAIIASGQAGCLEVVTNGVNGYIVDPKDARDVADRLQELLEDRELRLRMGRAGRRIAADKFDEKTIIAQTVQIYDRLLTRSA